MPPDALAGLDALHWHVIVQDCWVAVRESKLSYHNGYIWQLIGSLQYSSSN